MNKNKLRWKIYKLFRKIDIVKAKRGGYSYNQLITFYECLTGDSCEVYFNPIAAIEEWVKWYAEGNRLLHPPEEVKRCFAESLKLLEEA
ncbi:MAG: hypothetical protein KAR20_25390 [Candidatus Heimdallarchaeota archaeon]|nr:hypothetical protein [Candidatus Heimdallarchaeota archaeon]